MWYLALDVGQNKFIGMKLVKVHIKVYCMHLDQDSLLLAWFSYRAFLLSIIVHIVYLLGHIPFSNYFFLFQIYLMDIHIWYTVLSAIVGGVKGARARLGEVSTYFIIVFRKQ